MAGFQAVDLDSILDEFESKQSETEKEDRPGKPEIPIKDTYNTETWSSHQLDINKCDSYENENDSTFESPDIQTLKNDFALEVSPDKSQDEQYDVEIVKKEPVFNNRHETPHPTSTLSAQPDVLSGIENVIEREEKTIATHEYKEPVDERNNVILNNIISNNTLVAHEQISSLEVGVNKPNATFLSPNSESTQSSKSQSSPSFESIYDKYRSKDTDTDDEKVPKDDFSSQELGNQLGPIHLLDTSIECENSKRDDCPIVGTDSEINNLISYECPKVSSDELDELLQQLDSSIIDDKAAVTNTDITIFANHDSEGGARPKNIDMMPNIASSTFPVPSGIYLSSEEPDYDMRDKQPDLLTIGGTEERTDLLCAENPSQFADSYSHKPPNLNISEGPITQSNKDEKLGRPTSLDLEQTPSTYDICSGQAVPEDESYTASAPIIGDCEETGPTTGAEKTTMDVEGESEHLAPIVGPPGSTPANPNGPNTTGIPELLQGMTEEQLMLGKVSPFWIPDTEALTCMICDAKFTMVKRRHHCRACGKVLCTACCSEKFSLSCLEGKEGRVCTPCKGILDRLQRVEQMSVIAGVENSNSLSVSNVTHHNIDIQGDQSASNAFGQISNEIEASSGAMPVSVLKRTDGTAGTPIGASSITGGAAASNEAKQVMFSDGIRPGGDLTELDGPENIHRHPKRSGSKGSSRKHRREHREKSNGSGSSDCPLKSSHKNNSNTGELARSMIPIQGLPYVSGQGPVDDNILSQRFEQGMTIPFSLNRNLRVYVTLVKCYSPINKPLWNYKTQGLSSVGQDELVILLVQNEGELTPSRSIFDHFQHIYEQAAQGRHFSNMDHSVISGKEFLEGTEYGGFLYIRHTFQCIDDLDLPSQQPFLFGILLTKWEMPWARVFPLRLLLRLGAECRYYPSPLWSIRARNTVYKEIGNTIMKLLSDFRNFTYSLPIIRGLVIHMEDKLTTVIIPKNSYSQIQRALQNSNDPVLALGGNFSSNADSHLVAVQRDEDTPSRNPMNNSDYETQAINIANKSRKVTGASFLVLNGALKSSSGLSAKSSIVEDGIMVQVSQDRMMEIRKALNKMIDVKIDCGPVAANEIEAPDETVYIKWTDKNPSINSGRKSLVDGRPMDGIPSIRMTHAGPDYTSKSHMIRWTEVFMLPNNKITENVEYIEPPDPSRITSHIAKAISMALLPNLKQLKAENLSPLAVKVCLDPENTSYEAGSKGIKLPAEFMNNLDNELVPIIHGQSSPSANSYELVFHILDL